MKLLYLLRHAKSSWDDPTRNDFDRPLNRRGQKTAKRMAEHFRRAGLQPAAVLCSPSLRTRQTLEPLMPVLGAASVTFEPRIYEGTRQTLLDCLADVPDDVASVLLIGHNPGLEHLATALAIDSGAAFARLREKFPTGCLAVLSTADASWRRLRPASCRLEELVRPADLKSHAAQ
jgi:phosphohistidine phosphatase